MLNRITSSRAILSSISESLWKGQRQLLMDLAVTKSSEKAICRKKEESQEPGDASKQTAEKGSPEVARPIRQLLAFTRPLLAFLNHVPV